jgi:hypothetical protein
MLNLLRYSQLLALAVLVAVVVALSMLYRGLVFDAMIESESHASVALTKTFANAVWPGHAAFVKRAGSLDRATLAERPEIAALDHELRRLADGRRSRRSTTSCGAWPTACRSSRSRSMT